MTCQKFGGGEDKNMTQRIETANLNETILTLTRNRQNMLIENKLIIANLEIKCSCIPFRRVILKNKSTTYQHHYEFSFC